MSLPNWNLPDVQHISLQVPQGNRNWRLPWQVRATDMLTMQVWWSTIGGPLTFRHVYNQTLGGNGKGIPGSTSALHEAATPNVRPSGTSNITMCARHWRLAACTLRFDSSSVPRLPILPYYCDGGSSLIPYGDNMVQADSTRVLPRQTWPSSFPRGLILRQTQ